MLEYHISAHSTKGGEARAEANKGVIPFDASTGKKDALPNPTELLLTSLAACMLKNVERFSVLLKFDYDWANIEVHGVRNDSPSYISEVTYTLTIASEMEERTTELLHRNILKYGTITNTIAKAVKLQGTITTTRKQEP